MCIYLDKVGVDFKGEYNDDAIFNGDKTFNFAEFRDNDKEIWKQFVKEEENTGIGGINPGMMVCGEKFTIAICSSCEDEDLAEVCAMIPHFEHMAKIVIEWSNTFAFNKMRIQHN